MAPLKMVIPKGKLHARVLALLNDAGLGVETDPRLYVPRVAAEGIAAKLLKPQNIPRLLDLGAHDLGFTGRDWLEESGAQAVELLDLGFDPVRIVAAVPANQSLAALRRRRIVAASEYENLARRFLDARGFRYEFIRTYGATEVFPPDDADLIVDNSSTGRTLRAHQLKVAAVILESTTRLVAGRAALEDRAKRERIEELVLLFRSLLDARERVMLEMNVLPQRLDGLVAALPCMRAPTVARLFGDQGYSVKAAVPRREVAALIPRLKRLGASDILEYEFRKVVL